MNSLDVRKYYRNESIVFRKTRESFGGLSNMASGFPIVLNGVRILSSEALYQACRYPNFSDVQKNIIAQKSPMTAKMISKKYRDKTRPNWDNERIKIMRWCLRVKMFQNWEKFSTLLISTENYPIVEESMKDDFWGAKPFDNNLLIGTNSLGRLLMELREEIKGFEYNKKYILNPPNIENFLFLGKQIEKTYLIIEKKNPENKGQNLEASFKQISMSEFL